MIRQHDCLMPGANLDTLRMPGHWLLARLGKRVLRPGGLELTHRMLEGLAIGKSDRVVEVAPGMGATAALTLAKQPASYVAIDRDEAAVAQVAKILKGETQRCHVGQAHETGLADGSASVFYGEAMLTMQPDAMKRRIIAEAFRCLERGGRYGIHEMSLQPDDVAESVKTAIFKDLSSAIHVGARPLTVEEWRALLEGEGFVAEAVAQAPMHLLEVKRFVRDEGLARSLKFLWNVLRDPDALKRVLEMRAVFRRHMAHMGAIAIVARKP
jgi:NAD(P)-dependent dehydrogenase (short-subunit alcohol dehydrogenase family)